jgi:hypothetical protein
MKKGKKPAGRKGRGGRRKPIMRHSREGVAGRKAKRAAGRKRAAASRRSAGSATRRRAAAKARVAAKSKARKPRVRRPVETEGKAVPVFDSRGLGAESGGQSGDTEGLSRVEDVDFESVEELVEEGQAYEAGVVSGVEEADGDPRPLHAREVPVDDVPEEYLDED